MKTKKAINTRSSLSCHAVRHGGEFYKSMAMHRE